MVFVVRAYGRASTEKQIVSLEQQESVTKDAFMLFKRIKPTWADAEWGGFFKEDAITRTSKFRERPMGSLVLAATKPGDAILASNFDRIFANVADVSETLDLIDQRKIQIIVLDLDIPLDTNLGQALFKIMAAVKELDVKETRRRGRESAAHRKAEGLPNTKPPVGWKTVGVKNKSGFARRYLVPNEATRALAMRLLSLHQQFESHFKSFTIEMNARNIRHPSGRRWNQVSLKRWVDAAAAGFPLKNGQHEAAPIPPDAEPIETIAPCD